MLRDKCRVYDVATSKKKNINVVRNTNVEGEERVPERVWECWRGFGRVGENVGVLERMWECWRVSGSARGCVGVSERIWECQRVLERV